MRLILLISLLMAACAASAYSQPLPPEYAKHPEIQASREREATIMVAYDQILRDLRQLKTALERVQESRASAAMAFVAARLQIVGKLESAKAAKEAAKKPVAKKEQKPAVATCETQP